MGQKGTTMNMRIAAGLGVLLWAGTALAEPIVIAHRGASGYLPEHTLPAYAAAHAMGADYIEPDLVMTQDGVLICLHDIHLEGTTDVEQVFPGRAREDGRWYAADLTLAEIRQLEAHERTPRRFPQDRARFFVPTFAEMIELVQGMNAATGREAGIYPELKAPMWHTLQDLPMEETFLDVVRTYGYRGRDAKIFVQCFEAPPLLRLRELGCDLPMVQLLGSALSYATISAKYDIPSYAQGLGPNKGIIEADPAFVARAHAQGLVVHPYTFRADAVGEGYDD